MPLGHDPDLEWEPGRERAEGEEMFRLLHGALLHLLLLVYDVAVDAALLVVVEGLRPVQLLLDVLWYYRGRYYLGVRVRKRGPGGPALVLEHEDVAEARVLLQVLYPVPVSRKHPD